MINNAVVFTYYDNNIMALQVIDDKHVNLQLTPNDDIHLKSVYIGKVKNIVKNIQAAFVEIAPGKICFLPLNNVGSFHILNRAANNDIKCGDELLVQIIKGAVKEKDPVCSGEIRLSKAILNDILSKSKTRCAYSVLYSGAPAYLNFLGSIDISSVEKIVCADDILFQEVDAYLDTNAPDKRVVLTQYSDDYPLNKLYKIDSLINELTDRVIWLKSGANLIIDYTEAMTVIDINTGKSIKDKNDNHILSTNMEAVKEAIRQIRLRNLSGMILLDCINDNEENTNKLIEYIKELTERETVTTRYIDITGLGIIELTRAKQLAPITEILKKPKITQNMKDLRLT